MRRSLRKKSRCEVDELADVNCPWLGAPRRGFVGMTSFQELRKDNRMIAAAGVVLLLGVWASTDFTYVDLPWHHKKNPDTIGRQDRLHSVLQTKD